MQVTAQSEASAPPARAQLHGLARGRWWDVLEGTGRTLLVTREYEHFVAALSADGRPSVSYLPLPHPSGLAVDEARRVVHVASTRNPNQLVTLTPIRRLMPRGDHVDAALELPVLMPIRTVTLPGCLYLHDLAFVDGALHANAVGQNAIVRFSDDGRWQRVWWPRCVEQRGRPIIDRNLIQLNSIAAGKNLRESYFSASTTSIDGRRPGRRDFAVDRRGVVFDGETRTPIVYGLTRPHSARIHRGTLWVLNSGYGEFGMIEGGRFETVSRLPGWTRGLCFHDRIAFVGVSRVIPRFERYAPGLDAPKSACGIHAVDTRSGEVLGSLVWPGGDQIFALALVPRDVGRLPGDPRRGLRRQRTLFYAFDRSPSRGGTLEP